MNDEEVAFRIVRLYFEEIARLGFKRQLDLDQIINSYFYTLNKLGNKEELMEKALKKIVEEEQKILEETKRIKQEVIKNSDSEVNEKNGNENSFDKSNTNSNSTNNKSITDIIEGK